jgi:hypothetical protein
MASTLDKAKFHEAVDEAVVVIDADDLARSLREQDRALLAELRAKSADR